MPCVCGLEGSGEPPGALGGTRSTNRAICRMLAWGAGGGQVSGSHANTQLTYCNQDMQEDHPGCPAHPPVPALPQI